MLILEQQEDGSFTERSDEASDYLTELAAVDLRDIVRIHYNSEDKITVLANHKGEELYFVQPHWNEIIEQFNKVKQYY